MAIRTLGNLLPTQQTVFTMRELGIFWGIANQDYLKTKAYRLVRDGHLQRLRKGIFALTDDYNRHELAGKLLTPSYISLETVLRRENMVFQEYQDFFSIGNLSKTIAVAGNTFVYRKIKSEILLNPRGITKYPNYCIATLSRAFLDCLYLFPSYYFDNLRPLNWIECLDVLPIYHNKRLTQQVTQWYQEAQHA